MKKNKLIRNILFLIPILVGILVLVGIIKEEKNFQKEDTAYYTDFNPDADVQVTDMYVFPDDNHKPLPIVYTEEKPAESSTSKTSNSLRYSRGIRVDNHGSFEVKLNGVKYKISTIDLKCPNKSCNRSCSLSFDYLRNGNDIGYCSTCRSELNYSSINFDSTGILYDCPDCGNRVSTYKRENYCSKCGKDLAPIRELFMSTDWR